MTDDELKIKIATLGAEDLWVRIPDRGLMTEEELERRCTLLDAADRGTYIPHVGAITYLSPKYYLIRGAWYERDHNNKVVPSKDYPSNLQSED